MSTSVACVQCADRIERQVAPQLQPDLGADVVEHARLEARPGEDLRHGPDPLRHRPVELAERKPVALDVPNHAGFGDDRGGIRNAADDPVRVDGTVEHAAGIDGLDDAPGVLAAELLEVPPGDAVLQGDHGRFGAEEHRQVVDDGRDLVRLEGQQHQVVGIEVADAVRGRQIAGDQLLLGLHQPQAARPDGGQVRSARNHGHPVSGVRQTHGHVAADGAGADDADLHGRGHTGHRGRGPRRTGKVTAIAPAGVVGEGSAHPPNSVTPNTRARITMAVRPLKTVRLNQANPRSIGDG